MSEETRRASADGHQRGVAEAMKEKRGRVGREKEATGPGETLGCRRKCKTGRRICARARGGGRRRRGDGVSRILLGLGTSPMGNGGNPGPTPHHHRPPQLLLLPQRTREAATRRRVRPSAEEKIAFLPAQTASQNYHLSVLLVVKITAKTLASFFLLFFYFFCFVINIYVHCNDLYNLITQSPK
jgi:hypothetical protein